MVLLTWLAINVVSLVPPMVLVHGTTDITGNYQTTKPEAPGSNPGSG
jgi:hypothetical protein